ncbi:MAG: BlaI/MecI/CopY family transcriptional regulator [Lachnospiraceae bacterium]|nr:BlaI/MecI/CopY family transcriptional regulator [Lachnospiraceae bacterium]
MSDIQMGAVESRFADIVWKSVPIKTSELVKIAEREFSWKRTTTHTVIKRLCEKGLFVNNSGTITALMSREQYYSMQSMRVVQESFDGSLPAFVAAFTSGRKLSPQEADEIRKIIEEG